MDRYRGSFVQIFGCNLWRVLGSTLLYSTVLPVNPISRYSSLHSSFIYTHSNMKPALILSKHFTYLITHLLIYSMQKSHSWEATRFPGNQESPRTFWTRKFITAFKISPHLSLSWTSTIQPILPQTTSWISILILSSLLRLGFSSGLFLSGLPLNKQLYTYLQSLAVERAIYNCPWYQHMQTARHILFIIMRAQKPVRLTAGKFYIVSLETYLQV